MCVNDDNNNDINIISINDIIDINNIIIINIINDINVCMKY